MLKCSSREVTRAREDDMEQVRFVSRALRNALPFSWTKVLGRGDVEFHEIKRLRLHVLVAK